MIILIIRSLPAAYDLYPKIDREKEKEKRKRLWMIQKQKEREYERLKQKYIEEYERQKAEALEQENLHLAVNQYIAQKYSIICN